MVAPKPAITYPGTWSSTSNSMGSQFSPATHFTDYALLGQEFDLWSADPMLRRPSQPNNGVMFTLPYCARVNGMRNRSTTEPDLASSGAFLLSQTVQTTAHDTDADE